MIAGRARVKRRRAALSSRPLLRVGRSVSPRAESRLECATLRAIGLVVGRETVSTSVTSDVRQTVKTAAEEEGTGKLVVTARI